jgi:AmmeMemoRadiSam system protein B/AmmeMemoRadiSam system protein A
MTHYIKWMLIFLLLVSCALTPADKKIRDHLTTINWYPSAAPQLTRLVDHFFKQASPKKIPGRVVGIVSPHAGLTYSGQCAANGFKQISDLREIKRVILLGVAHRGGFYGAAVSDFQFNSTPMGLIPVDTNITAKLAKEKLFRKNNRIMQQEHSLENQLPLLQYAMNQAGNTNYKIVPVLFSQLNKKDAQKVASIIKRYVDDHTIVVASTDFTHYGSNYGYTPFYKDIKNNLTRLDMGMIAHINKLNIDDYYLYKKKTGITMCGFTPVAVLIHLFQGKEFRGTLVDYYKSGDRSNNYSLSVSYASVVISKQKGAEMKDDESLQLPQKEKKILLTLARRTLEEHFAGGRLSMEEFKKNHNLSPVMQEERGVFVTLKKRGRLRGCIGSIIGQEPLYQGIQNNALKAALQDPRFPQVKAKELPAIDMEISVMTPLQKISDYKTIRLGIDGVIIKKGYRQAVFLPQVATETGWTLDRFLGQLCRKAGLSHDAYRSGGIDFYIFQALVFGEKDLEE